MITFKNIAGNKFLAVGTIQRKSALNGEKSLTGTLYDGKDVLNKIDKGWSLEFDGEPYVVTYFERTDNDNSVSFDAIHKLFWDMTKGVLYSETSGSHTIKWYLDTIFADTNYSYALNFNPNAIQKENWGMKNKLSLFNDIISSIEGEFEINGTLISIFRNVGTDLSTIVRHGFNLSDMTLENDASGFVTYGEGFGAYADQENQTGPRLHVTYTSPLASVYGKLQAEPVDNQNYTISNNLLAAVKSKVDASFSISIKLSLYDLTVAGYPYKMANVGDWLTAVDENLDFKQRIRIISIDDEFSANGTRIRYTVTAGDIGLTKKYQNTSASLVSQVANAISLADKALADANYATIAANGKNTSYYLNSIDDLPKVANEGDLSWVQSGDGRVLYIYTKKTDGSYYWEKRIDPEMGAQISDGVENAVSQANQNTEKLVTETATKINKTISDVDAKANQLKKDQATFDNKAQGYASNAEINARANTAALAQQTAQNSQTALNQAKSDLTNGIAKETADRASAVSALDTKAQGYATSAKADAIGAANTADGKTRKYIDDTATTIGNTIQQNKKTSDDGIYTATSKAQQALDGFQNTVSKTDYDKKTGDLSTEINKTTQTANQSKQDIIDIKQADGKQDGRMNTIESDARGTKQTVSDLQDIQGTQSGSISTLQQRADGFDVSVSQVMTTNLVVNSEFDNSTGEYVGWHLDNPWGVTVTTQLNKHGNKTKSEGQGILYPQGSQMVNHNYDYSPQWIYSDPIVMGSGQALSGSLTNANPSGATTDVGIAMYIVAYDKNKNKIPGVVAVNLKDSHGSWLVNYFENKLTKENTAYISFCLGWNNGMGYFGQPMLQTSDKYTGYIPSQNSSNLATAKAQLTADQAALNLKNYQTDANGRISQAQADIRATAKEVTTRVSQSDYNAKTGDLTSKISTAQQTADQAKTSVADYKKLNDGRVSAVEANIKTQAGQIDLAATKSEVNTAKGELNGIIANLKIDNDKIIQSVGEINSKVNDLGQINLVNNSNFAPDLAGWHLGSPWGKPVTNELKPNGVNSDDNTGAVWMSHDQADSSEWLYSNPIPVVPALPVSVAVQVAVVTKPTSGVPIALYVQAYDNNQNRTDSFGYNIPLSALNGVYNQFKLENIKLSSNAKYVAFVLGWNIAGRVYFGKSMLVFDSKVGKYVPGAYNNNDRIAATETTLKGISDTVSDPNNGLAKRVLTAEGQLLSITNPNTGLQRQITDTAQGVRDETTNRIKGDANTLSSAADFTTRQISSYNAGVQSQFTQTSDALIAQIGSNNLVPNSEFDPLNVNWYNLPAVGNSVGSPILLGQTYSFSDWAIVNGSRGINYSGTGWIVSEPIRITATSQVSMSLLAGRSDATNGPNQTFDFRLALFDINKKYLTSIGSSNPINNTGYKAVQRYVKENLTLPSNTSYVGIILAHSGNVTDAIFQPMINIGSTAYKYTATHGTNASSTVLSLLKDNWAMGVSDNIGNITNGLVADTSSMALVSKNVTINSPQTQINGKAWIQSADIANGAIGTVQIGDAAITSAKIANLDVSKLTGDTITGFNINANRRINIASGGSLVAPMSGKVGDFTPNAYYYSNLGSASDWGNNPWFTATQAGTLTIDTSGTLHVDGTITAPDVKIGSTTQYAYYTQTANGTLGGTNKLQTSISLGLNGLRIDQADARGASYGTGGYVFVTGHGFYTGYDQANPRFAVSSDGKILTDSIAFSGGSNFKTINSASFGTSNIRQDFFNNSYNLYVTAGGYMRLSPGNASNADQALYVFTDRVSTKNKILAGNMAMDDHTLRSYDGGKLWMSQQSGATVDLGVRSLSQSSLVSLKEHISNINPEFTLAETLKADIRGYNFIGSDIKDRHVTPMIDDVDHEMYIPDDWLSADGTSVDTYSMIGYLIGSVKALQSQITELKANQ